MDRVTGEAVRLQVLAAVAQAAEGTQLLGETVQRLLDAIVPAFADVATLDVVSATGEMRRLGARVDRPATSIARPPCWCATRAHVTVGVLCRGAGHPHRPSP
jgi:hypothetical protein